MYAVVPFFEQGQSALVRILKDAADQSAHRVAEIVAILTKHEGDKLVCYNSAIRIHASPVLHVREELANGVLVPGLFVLGKGERIEKLADDMQFAGKKRLALEMHETYEQVYDRERAIPANYPPLAAELGRVEKARELFFKGFSNDLVKREMHTNFIVFLLNHPEQLDADTGDLARGSMPYFAEDVLEKEKNPGAVAYAASLAGAIGLYNVAELMFARAYELEHAPAYFHKGRAACLESGRKDCDRRWSKK